MRNLAQLLPPLYAVSNQPDPIVTLKAFMPDGPGTWYLLEFDPEERIAFCFADIGLPDCAELGYVSLDELESIRGVLGLKVELDKFWTPCPLSEIIAGRRQ